MEEDYYFLTSELDAREVLRYLNDLGIHNISGEVLKYFITDLKKLIKYDLQKRYKLKEQEDERPGPERLHSATTLCSRLRSKGIEGEIIKCDKGFGCKRPFKVRNVQSAPVLGQNKVASEELPMRRACSCNTVTRKSAKDFKVGTTLSNNLIIVPRPVVKKKSDPVSLYHYYTALWAKYKPNVPGENNWSDLRWTIRQKMAGLDMHSEHKVGHAVMSKENINSRK